MDRKKEPHPCATIEGYHPSYKILADRIEVQRPDRNRAMLSPLENYIAAQRPPRKRKFAFDDYLVGSLEGLCYFYKSERGISRNATIRRIAERLYNEIGGKKAGPSVESITWRLNEKLKKRIAAQRSAPPESVRQKVSLLYVNGKRWSKERSSRTGGP